MATKKQLAANRANAKKSTGPRTPEGKARSARNALTHGLASDALAVLRIECPDQIDLLKRDAVEVYRPVNNEELFAVERIALTKLAIIRAARLEAGLFTSMLDHSLNADNITPYTPLDPRLTQDVELHKDQNRNFGLATGFQRLLHSTDAFTLFLRYQTHAERLYRRAVQAFDDLRSRRPDVAPNEPDFSELESPQPLSDAAAPSLPPSSDSPPEPHAPESATDALSGQPFRSDLPGRSEHFSATHHEAGAHPADRSADVTPLARPSEAAHALLRLEVEVDHPGSVRPQALPAERRAQRTPLDAPLPRRREPGPPRRTSNRASGVHGLRAGITTGCAPSVVRYTAAASRAAWSRPMRPRRARTGMGPRSCFPRISSPLTFAGGEPRIEIGCPQRSA